MCWQKMRALPQISKRSRLLSKTSNTTSSGYKQSRQAENQAVKAGEPVSMDVNTLTDLFVVANSITNNNNRTGSMHHLMRCLWVLPTAELY